ncbi:MAG: hypothetical protein MJ171_02940 [Clostridia bacterium]|nr:hypothetical protein [Clostridia bacterium]
MAKQPKTTEIKFRVLDVDGVNEDGMSRQEILYDLAGNDPKDNHLQYHRGDFLENGHQVIDVMVNDRKIGEIDDEDYIVYQESIPNARGGFVKIYQEENEDGTIHCTCDSFMIVPYLNSETSKAALRKRKKISTAILIVLFFGFGIVIVFKGDFGPLVFTLVGSGILFYYVFIRDPRKDDAGYQFMSTGKRKKHF